MGATQCLTKYAAPIWAAPGRSLLSRLYALLSMSAYSTHLLLLVLLLVQLPLALSGYRMPSWLAVFGLIGLGQPLLFVLAQQILYHDWPRRLRRLPTLLLVAVGTAPSNAWAVMSALRGRAFTFVRTPKGQRQSYRLRPNHMLGIETALALYSAFTLLIALATGNTGAVALLATCLLGFSYVVLLTLLEGRGPSSDESFGP